MYLKDVLPNTLRSVKSTSTVGLCSLPGAISADQTAMSAYLVTGNCRLHDHNIRVVEGSYEHIDAVGAIVSSVTGYSTTNMRFDAYFPAKPLHS